jgi:hypothetical protein
VSSSNAFRNAFDGRLQRRDPGMKFSVRVWLVGTLLATAAGGPLARAQSSLFTVAAEQPVSAGQSVFAEQAGAVTQAAFPPPAADASQPILPISATAIAPGASEPSMYDATPAGGPATPTIAVAPPVPPASPFAEEAAPFDPKQAREYLERLRAAEDRIRQLESQQVHDERTRTVVQSLKERWDSAKDPSITTAEQQAKSSSTKKPSDKKWYDRLSIRGYAQFRLNETLERDEAQAVPQYVGDRSIGDDQSFLIRRARVIISGDVSDRLYVYLQPDFASTPNGSVDQIHFAQIRDWYGDVYLDDCKVHRLRFGQSKVPYGWENMQSSSNRLALDRSDGINSAVRNERDLGVFYYWTPEPAQDFFKEVLDQGLKGSGNYGVFGLGVYNGQGGSLAEQNDDVHVVSRLTLPYTFAYGQRCEFGIQGYTGRYTVLSSQIRALGVGPAITPSGTLENNGRRGIKDDRLATSFIWYPQPIGFQAEWNIGRGPSLNDAQTAVIERALYGGYIQAMLKYDTQNWGTLFPFVRYSQFQGGYKPERNAPFSNIEEVESGTEWQINPQMELTTAFLITDRTNTTALSGAGQRSYRQFEGSVLRFQFQINY